MAIELTCPAASPFHPPDSPLPGVVCGVIRNSNRDEEIAGWTERGQVSAVIHPRTDPSSIVAFCGGCYTDCPIWRAEKERVWAGRPELGGLHSEQHREPNPGRDRALEAIMAGSRTTMAGA